LYDCFTTRNEGRRASRLGADDEVVVVGRTGVNSRMNRRLLQDNDVRLVPLVVRDARARGFGFGFGRDAAEEEGTGTGA